MPQAILQLKAWPRACQVPLCASLHATIVLESETTFTQFRKGLTGLTSRNCSISIRRHWQTTTLTAPCQCLNHTHAPPHVPSKQRRSITPRSAVAASADTPPRASLRNYGRHSPPACQRRCSKSRHKLRDRESGCRTWSLGLSILQHRPQLQRIISQNAVDPYVGSFPPVFRNITADGRACDEGLLASASHGIHLRLGR